LLQIIKNNKIQKLKMNGLQIIDLKEANFMDKLLKREPRENAFLEINNLLASVPILKLDKESITDRLEKYEIPFEKARSRLMHFYSIILRYFVIDFDISDSQYEKLRHLQHILSIEDKDIGSIHSAILYPIYQQFVRNSLSKGKISESDKEQLRNFSEQLRIPKQFAVKLYKTEAEKFLHSKFQQTIADGMLSIDEEKELLKIADNLEIELRLSETAKQNLQRHRYLWQLNIGNLPTVKTNLILEEGEVCSAVLEVEYFEINNISDPIKFSGYETSTNLRNTGFHSGMVKTNRIQGEVMIYVSRGKLYFTNKRLLFNETRGTIQFLLKDLIGATFYNNGMLVELKNGSDKFFKFRGDLEAMKLIFNGLMTKKRG
jgi:hypothetical protein